MFFLMLVVCSSFTKSVCCVATLTLDLTKLSRFHYPTYVLQQKSHNTIGKKGDLKIYLKINNIQKCNLFLMISIVLELNKVIFDDKKKLIYKLKGSQLSVGNIPKHTYF